MILSSNKIAELLDTIICEDGDPLVMAPCPDIGSLKGDSSSSVDMRLGTWFRSTRTSRHSVLDIGNLEDMKGAEHNLTKTSYVPFGEKFILHPSSFVLAVTLEWIRIPFMLAAMVTGKSSWGRRGLIIETAPNVHPGYSGCLTLELTNVGDVPIALYPGTKICQLSLHELDRTLSPSEDANYVGQRKPRMGRIKLDDFAIKLMQI